MQRQEFSIDIQSPKEKVWSVLWDDKTFRDWANNIDAGMYLVGTLEQGAEVQFVSGNAEYGVTSVVEKLVPNGLVSFRHVQDFVPGSKKPEKKEWVGGEERYTLSERDGGVVTLTIALDTPPEHVENFKNIFPKALERIKELAEGEALRG